MHKVEPYKIAIQIQITKLKKTLSVRGFELLFYKTWGNYANRTVHFALFVRHLINFFWSKFMQKKEICLIIKGFPNKLLSGAPPPLKGWKNTLLHIFKKIDKSKFFFTIRSLTDISSLVRYRYGIPDAS